MATVTERTMQANGIELHLAEAGPASGPPVMLLHGFPEQQPETGAQRPQVGPNR